MKSERIPFFAVLIGINLYKATYPDLLPLKGAVFDALGFKKYLEDKLHVPSDQILVLTDTMATRSKIIGALKGLKDDKRIQKDDAIFLYYAGHGTEIKPPGHRNELGTEKIQAIVPHDCDVVDEQGKPVPPIPDYVLGSLLSDIAVMKGNNITAVFDCCHAASGTRSRNVDDIARSVELSLSDAYWEEFSQERSGMETVSRGAQSKLNPRESGSQELLKTNSGSSGIGDPYTPSKFRYHGLGSHVLLSACREDQKAHENGGRGRFSTALLELLYQVSPGMLRYCDIPKFLNFVPITGQDPQCEGLHTDRTLFNSNVLPGQQKAFPIFFDAKKNNGNGQYVVYGGEIHDIAPDSEFTVYKMSDIARSTQIGILYVAELKPFSFIAALPPNAPQLDVAHPLIAVQTKFGAQEHLRIYIPLGDGFHKTYNDLRTNSEWKAIFNNISLVDKSKDAQVEVALKAEDKVMFTLHTEVMVKNQVNTTQVVSDIEADLEGLAWIFSRMARFYRSLVHSNHLNSNRRPTVNVELYQLIEKHYSDLGDGVDDIFKPDGENLCVNGAIDLFVPNKEAEEIPYGIKLVNKSNLNLHANVFHFNNHDLEINCLARPHHGCIDQAVDANLPAGGVLSIGFGTAGYAPNCFSIASGSDIEVGFFKIFLSTESVDLSYLEQGSPFKSTGATRGISTYKGRPNWTDIVIPITLRRHRQSATDLKRN